MGFISARRIVDAMQWKRDGFVLTDDPKKIQVDVVHRFLDRDSYWAKGIPRSTVRKALRHSLNMSLLAGKKQVGFARVVTDYATFGYVADVFVLPEFRDLGLSKWLMDTICGHPRLQGFRRWILVTRDAHGLYRRNGFAALTDPSSYMERRDPDVYSRPR